MRHATNILRLSSAAALSLLMTLGMLGNTSAAGLLLGAQATFATQASRGDACCGCQGEGDAELDAHDAGEHGSATTDCEDDCPNCGCGRHAVAGLPATPWVLEHTRSESRRGIAQLPPASPLLDDPASVFRPPRA